MAIPSGLAASIGFGEEVTWGTAVTPTKWLPLVSESLTNEVERVESSGIISGRRIITQDQWEPGVSKISGDVELELSNNTIGTLLKHAFGAVNTTGPVSTIYTHALTPGDLTGKGLTVQVGRPDVTGTVRPYTYAGCKVASWELSLAPNEIPTMTFGLIGKSETTGTALTAPSYTSGNKPMSYAGTTINIPGASPANVCVRSLTISGDNALADDRMCVGQSTIDEPLEADLRSYEGELEVEFRDLYLYGLYTAGTTTAITITIVQGTAQLAIAANIRLDGSTPNVDGKGLVTASIPFKVVGTTTDALGITATYKSTDATV